MFADKIFYNGTIYTMTKNVEKCDLFYGICFWNIKVKE